MEATATVDGHVGVCGLSTHALALVGRSSTMNTMRATWRILLVGRPVGQSVDQPVSQSVDRLMVGRSDVRRNPSNREGETGDVEDRERGKVGAAI